MYISIATLIVLATFSFLGTVSTFSLRSMTRQQNSLLVEVRTHGIAPASLTLRAARGVCYGSGDARGYGSVLLWRYGLVHGRAERGSIANASAVWRGGVVEAATMNTANMVLYSSAIEGARQSLSLLVMCSAPVSWTVSLKQAGIDNRR